MLFHRSKDTHGSAALGSLKGCHQLTYLKINAGLVGLQDVMLYLSKDCFGFAGLSKLPLLGAFPNGSFGGSSPGQKNLK